MKDTLRYLPALAFKIGYDRLTLKIQNGTIIHPISDLGGKLRFPTDLVINIKILSCLSL